MKMQAWLERARTPRPAPSPESRACLSDPDSRLIPGKRGGYLQGYNIQIVCARRQFLLAIEAHDNPSDRTALLPMVKKTQHNHLAAALPGDVQLWLANSGYASAAVFEALADLPPLVSVTSDADQAGIPAKRQQAPAGQQDMAARLATPTGRAQYRQRSALVEPGFAQIFQRFGRHLNYRARPAVDAEINLLGTVHNLNLHIDIHASGDRTDPIETRKKRVDAEADRLMGLGAIITVVMYEKGIDHYAVGMKDPEGNEFDIN
ncbi:hypothetical protein [Streptomyces sp. NPDC055134]